MSNDHPSAPEATMFANTTDAQLADMNPITLAKALLAADEFGGFTERHEDAYRVAFETATGDDINAAENVNPAWANRLRVAFLAELAKTAPAVTPPVTDVLEELVPTKPHTPAERSAAPLANVDFTPAAVLAEDEEADPIDLEDTAADRFVW
jgi:hypothetical protein